MIPGCVKYPERTFSVDKLKLKRAIKNHSF